MEDKRKEEEGWRRCWMREERGREEEEEDKRKEEEGWRRRRREERGREEEV